MIARKFAARPDDLEVDPSISRTPTAARRRALRHTYLSRQLMDH